MKKIYYILTLLLCAFIQTANAQMGVNSNGAVPSAAAMLDVRSTDKGFLMPRLTTTQRTNMPAIADGLMIYNTTTAEIEVYRGLFGWQTASRMGVPFKVNGSITGGALTDAIIQSINNGTGPAVSGQTLGTGVGAGLFQGATANGVYALSISGNGVFATSSTGHGIYSQNNSSTNAAGKFVNNNAIGDGGRFDVTNGIGVFSNAVGTGNAVQGEANSGYGGYFRSTSGTGLAAISSSSYGIYAENTSATVPVAQLANLSGGIGLEVIASTALKITGAIKVAGGITAQPAFKITTVTGGGGNTTGNGLTIPNTTQANNANDILLVTHNYSPNNTYLNKAYGIYWNGASWVIYLEDLSAMPNNISFNVLVIKQ